MFRGIGKRLCQLKKHGSSVDRKRFVVNALKCFGISCLSGSKVEISDGSMEWKHFIITCTLNMNNKQISTYALIDCGATGITFID